MTTSGTNEAIDFSSKLGYVSGLQNVTIEKKKFCQMWNYWKETLLMDYRYYYCYFMHRSYNYSNNCYFNEKEKSLKHNSLHGNGDNND
jgi:hypothetical protein